MEFRIVRGVVDRIEESEDGRAIAVILIEDEGLQLDVPMDELPKPVAAGDWLKLKLDDANKISSVDILKEESERRRRELQERWDKLRGGKT